jgi:menaquinone-dependent protoporphyrinogen IX oxidase
MNGRAMNSVLVVYTTNSGSTEEVARVIAEELGAGGIQVDVRRLEEVTDLDSYATVVVGAPMILGWHRAALKFIKRHQAVLAQKRVAYFFTAMSLTQTNENRLGAVPVCIDAELAKPPKNPTRLSFKERYATMQNYLHPALKAAPGIKPVSAAIFGGKLELFRLKWWQMLFVMGVIGAPPGDRRNWTAIKAWAAQLRTAYLTG